MGENSSPDSGSPSSADTAAWRRAIGFRTDHRKTPEFEASRDDYVRRLWDQVAVPGENLTKPQIRARLGALHAVRADLDELVARACRGEIDGPDRSGTGVGEWGFPIGGRTPHPMGELRQPRSGCDEWGLHHRAYFGAPEVWPGCLIWALLAFKPDSSLDPEWRAIQDASIDEAVRIVADYIAGDGEWVGAVRDRIPPPL